MQEIQLIFNAGKGSSALSRITAVVGDRVGAMPKAVRKGYIFKTYEGRAIQAGFGKGKGANAGAIQSYEFDFSITDKAIADSLMRCGGKVVELHYKEYLGALPWRGKQEYIVDRIVSVRDN